MRRSLLTLTAIGFSAWSQPAPQQAQPPVVVQVQMPPESIWTTLGKLAIPTVLGAGLGAGLTLYGVGKTNKHNESENAANRKHELEKLNREHSFGLKRDVLTHVTQSLIQTFTALKDWDNSRNYLEYVEANGEEEHGQMKQAEEEVSKAWTEYAVRRNELEQATASACLAVSDELWKSAQAVGASIVEVRRQLVVQRRTPTKTVEQIATEIADFTKAAQKELGIIHIAPDATTGTTSGS